MTGEQTIVFSVVAGTLVLPVWGRWRYDLVTVTALVVAVALARLGLPLSLVVLRGPLSP